MFYIYNINPQYISSSVSFFFFFFNDPATTEIYTLSLHDALPIFADLYGLRHPRERIAAVAEDCEDRKSTRLNSSHEWRSYAVFCLKKKKPVIRGCGECKHACAPSLLRRAALAG